MIYLAHISIILRIIPVCLQWISARKKYIGAQFFFLLSLLSLGADLIGLVFYYYTIHTDFIFNLYQIGELIIATFLAITIGSFNKKIQSSLLLACALQIIFFVFIGINYNLNVLNDYITGISKLQILILIFVSAIHYIKNVETTRKIDYAPLIGLSGIFIFEALSIIPLISLNLQRNSPDHQKSFVIYFFLLLTGNFIRDLFISFNAILNLKKSP